MGSKAKTPLAKGLERQAAEPRRKPKAMKPAVSVSVPGPATRVPLPPSRAGRVLIAGHFAPQVQKGLKQLALDQDSTVQALLTEAIDMLFAKYHRPEIAEISPEKPQ
jgi:hypothetical protein